MDKQHKEAEQLDQQSVNAPVESSKDSPSTTTTPNTNTEGSTGGEDPPNLEQQLKYQSQNSIQAKKSAHWQMLANTSKQAQENSHLKPVHTGIPKNIQGWAEHMSGVSLRGVRVYYNSKKATEAGKSILNEYPNIYVAAGQEEQLSTAVWDIAQQLKKEQNAPQKQPETTQPSAEKTNARPKNNSNIPKALQEKIEQLSGVSLGDVAVHYNSLEPFEFDANAITRNNEVFLAPKQEQHLEEELWHTVQQKKGLVKPTGIENGAPVNTDSSLENAAKKGQHQEGETSKANQQEDVIQKNDDHLTFTIKIEGKLTGAEFVTLMEKQIYGQVVGSSWTYGGVTIESNQTFGEDGKTTSYNVQVPAAKYQNYRAQSATAKGVELDDNRQVKGAAQRSKALEDLPKGTKSVLLKEIDRRFREASGRDQKGEGDEALWNIYRDEVLAQREKVLNLSAKAKQVVKKAEEGGLAIAPKDYPKMIQLLEKIEQMDGILLAVYASRTTIKATSIQQIEQSLDSFVEAQEKRGENKKERTVIENALFATEGLFDEQDDDEVKKYGFKDLEDYNSKIDAYLTSFQQEAVATGIGLLQRYEHLLYEEEQRYLASKDAKGLGEDIAKSGAPEKYKESDQNASNARMAGISASILHSKGIYSEDIFEQKNYSDKSKQQETEADNTIKAFGKEHPLLEDPALDLKKLSQQSPEETQAFLLSYIKKQRESIAATKEKMQSDPDFVFTLDNLMQQMYQQEDISKDSIQYKAIQDRIGDIQSTEMWTSIGIGLLAIGLGVVSFGSGTVGVLALAGGAALSVYDVTREFSKYNEEQDAHDVGLLSNDPSFGWVILAIVGAGLDVVAAAKALKGLKEPVKAFNKSVKIKPEEALEELGEQLKGISAIDDKLKANILKRAENKAAYKKAKGELKGISRIEIIPYSSELFTWAVYAVKDGITRVDDFFVWLKKEEIIKSISKKALSAEELEALKISLKQAQDNITFVDAILTPNLAKRLSAEPERFLPLDKVFDEEELLQLVNAGRGSNLSKLEIEDIVLNACRKKKDFSTDEVIQQMSTWPKVKTQGYPTIFESLKEFQKFSTIVKGLAKKWGLPVDNIVIQGSSLRVEDVSKIDDLDVSILVDQKTFEGLVRKFRNNVDSENVIGKIDKQSRNGKIGGNNMFMGEGPTIVREFYDTFKAAFGVEFPIKLGVSKIQISVIKQGSKLEVTPYLKIK